MPRGVERAGRVTGDASHGSQARAKNKINDIVESVILGNAEADAALAEGQKSFAPVIEAYNKSIGK